MTEIDICSIPERGQGMVRFKEPEDDLSQENEA